MANKFKRLLASILAISVSASMGIFAVACNDTPDNGDEGGKPPITGDEGNNPGGDEGNKPGGDEGNEPGGDEGNEPETTYTITLNANGGTLPAGAVTTYTTKTDGTIDLKGEEFLPVATPAAENWYCTGWATTESGEVIDETTATFEADTTLYAQFVRNDGLWNADGSEMILSLTVNQGNTEVGCTEYWFGAGVEKNIAKDTVLTVHLNGKEYKNFWLNGTCIDLNGTSGMNADKIMVTDTADFVVYIKVYANGGTNFKFTGTPAFEKVSTVPDGCVAINITWGADANEKSMTLYILDTDGNAMGADGLDGYYIYAYNGSDNLFGNWQSLVINETGKLSTNMTGGANLTNDGFTFIFRWGSIDTTTGNGGSQSPDLTGMKAGHSYIVNLSTNVIQEYVPADAE